MQRASTLLRGLRLPGEPIGSEELACGAWAGAVGKKIAAHTRALRMVRTRLIVEVEDAFWQRQLFALSGHILRNLEKHLGQGIVDDLEFRIIPRRREPQRALNSAPGLAAIQNAAIQNDEADTIADPVLRSIYRASRLKAQAS